MSTTTTVAGGAWYDGIDVCRSAYRDDRHPGNRFGNLSIRLALDTGPVQPRRLTTIAGGAWNNDAFYRCYRRSAYRPYYWNLSHRYHNIGLRLALTASIEP